MTSTLMVAAIGLIMISMLFYMFPLKKLIEDAMILWFVSAVVLIWIFFIVDYLFIDMSVINFKIWIIVLMVLDGLVVLIINFIKNKTKSVEYAGN